MSATFDILLCLAIAVGFIVGAVRGFVRSVAKPIRIVCAGFLAYLLCSVIGPNLIQPVVQAPISNQVSDFLVEKCETLDIDHLPSLLKFAASLCNLDLSAYEGETTEESAHLIAEAVAEPLARILSIAIAFVLLFILCSLLLRLLLAVIDHSLKNSPLKGFNRALGSVTGGLMGIVCVWLFCALFTWVVSLPAFAEAEWAIECQKGVVYGLFRSIDPLELLLSF